ncbi:hypothetical protein [Massilia psychrophila]|nr:hypothetical protein [Massilia psychrophila]GGE64830.1 hypothetical protein GCM10008020_06340 [Massilia psychrophila]
MKALTSGLAAAMAITFVPSLAYASCSSAFCTVNTNWSAQSALVEAGSSFDLRYEYIDQTQLFSGTDKIAAGQFARPDDEISTANRNLVATYSRNFGNGWGLTLSAPVTQRDHVHLHKRDGEPEREEWKFTKLGDMRAVGRYQFAAVGDPLNPSTSGVTLGLKLPTGHTSVSNANGDVAERSLQPGTGTTDLIAGYFYHQKLSASNASWFGQAQFQHALNSHSGFKPGAQLNMDVGYRRGVGDRLGLLMQLNLVHKRADRGSEAEPLDSGSRFVFASPGLSYAVSDNLQVYGFFQFPLYRRVTGVQLSADRAFVVGLSGLL